MNFIYRIQHDHHIFVHSKFSKLIVIEHFHISTVKLSKLTWASNVFAVWHRLLEGHNTNPGDTSYRNKNIDFYYHFKGK